MAGDIIVTQRKRILKQFEKQIWQLNLGQIINKNT